MKSMYRKWWLALPLLCLAPITTFAGQEQSKLRDHHNYQKARVPVPEGGSSLVYVLGAGVACLGAMLVRLRSAKPKES